MIRRRVGLRRIAPKVLAAWAGLVLAAAPLVAQDPSTLASRCESAGGETGLCGAAATSAEVLRGQFALLGGAGASVPGTASNLGTRVGGQPRLAFFVRGLAAPVRLADPVDASGEAGSDAWVQAVHLGAAAGIFEGFRLMPTVGGFLSTDLFAHAALLFPSESRGFADGRRSYTAGVRVGLFREGFTVPGVSVSVARRFSGPVTFGRDVPGGLTEISVDPDVTSIRATVGKDLFAVELLGGVGWDLLSGEATVQVPDAAQQPVTATASPSRTRKLYFGSAAMTFSLVFNLSFEAGWAEGLDVSSPGTGDFDPSGGAFYGGVSARLVF